MCIICKVTCGDNPYPNIEIASKFLIDFARAQQVMKMAAAGMLEVSKIACTAEDRKRYDSIHKEMVRQCREWNKLEQRREDQQ